MTKSLSALLLTLTLSPALMAADKAGSLYQRLGGEPVVAKVVEAAVGRVARDPRVNQSFHNVNLRRVNRGIVEQICMLTGGGCRYTGDDMKKVHAGLDITEQAFNALVAALRDELDRNGVGEREKNELLRILAPMKRDIVTR